jgi:flagellar biosynthesis protein FlhG
MENQALNIHAVPASCRASATVLAVTSGKGGVGKTNVAANLAVCLAARNKRVLLLDADISLGNLDLVMDIRGKCNISHVLAGHKSLDEIIQPGPNGLWVICGASGLDRLANIGEAEQHRIIQHLCGLQQQADAIVIDTAAGISSSVTTFCLASDHVLVVTTPEAAAMADGYGIIKVLVRKRYQGPISLLVNMARNTAEGKQTYQRIANVARKFLHTNIYHAGTLLKDERLCTAVRSRQPVVLAYPRSQISLSFAALATRLSGTRPCDKPDDGFFRRVARWLN